MALRVEEREGGVLEGVGWGEGSVLQGSLKRLGVLEPDLSEALVAQGCEFDEAFARAVFEQSDGVHKLDEKAVLQLPASARREARCHPKPTAKQQRSTR